jgi:hypothetical protein
LSLAIIFCLISVVLFRNLQLIRDGLIYV